MNLITIRLADTEEPTLRARCGNYTECKRSVRNHHLATARDTFESLGPGEVENVNYSQRFSTNASVVHTNAS